MHPGREPRDNARFLITTLETPPLETWKLQCGMGHSESRIKELKTELDIGLTSCKSYAANQFRMVMTSMVYHLLQELRTSLRGTLLANAKVGTLRSKLLKVAALVKETVRRLVRTFPQSYPFQDLWLRPSARAGPAGARPSSSDPGLDRSSLARGRSVPTGRQIEPADAQYACAQAVGTVREPGIGAIRRLHEVRTLQSQLAERTHAPVMNDPGQPIEWWLQAGHSSRRTLLQ